MKLFSRLFSRKKTVPVIYKIGWWSNQELLEVTSFEVTVVKSNLNLLNSISVIRYTLRGTLQSDGFGTPYIQAIHHAEQLMPAPDPFAEKNEDAIMPVHAHLQLTPVVGIKNKKPKTGGPIPFELTTDYKIRSLRWGHNCFEFTCAGMNRKIHLSQRK